MAAAGEPADDRIDDVGMSNPSDRDDVGERWIRGDGDRRQAEGSLGPSV
jgi:phosphoribosylamine--glycine ligase